MTLMYMKDSVSQGHTCWLTNTDGSERFNPVTFLVLAGVSNLNP